MKLYYSPGACSLGIHFLMEEIGLAYETVPIRVKEGDQFREDYVRLNPKSKVPLLERDDGSLLSEFGAIAHWLAHARGRDRFKPASLEQEVRTMEVLDYVVGTVHMQGFSRILRPQKFTPSEADVDTVRETGIGIVRKGLANLSVALGDKRFIMGEALSTADAAVFYILFWATQRVQLELPGNIARYHAELMARPAAAKVMEDEGLI